MSYDCQIIVIWLQLEEDAAREATKAWGADWEAGGEGAQLHKQEHQVLM